LRKEDDQGWAREPGLGFRKMGPRSGPGPTWALLRRLPPLSGAASQSLPVPVPATARQPPTSSPQSK